MRSRIRCIFILVLLLMLGHSYGQKSNKPVFRSSSKESLGESDNHFGRGHKRGIKGIFSKNGGNGFDHKKKTQHFSSHKKRNRDSFQKKHYTGKKGLFGRRKSNGWGGKAFKTNGGEDKRLFKGTKKKK